MPSKHKSSMKKAKTRAQEDLENPNFILGVEFKKKAAQTIQKIIQTISKIQVTVSTSESYKWNLQDTKRYNVILVKPDPDCIHPKLPEPLFIQAIEVKFSEAAVKATVTGKLDAHHHTHLYSCSFSDTTVCWGNRNDTIRYWASTADGTVHASIIQEQSLEGCLLNIVPSEEMQLLTRCSNSLTPWKRLFPQQWRVGIWPKISLGSFQPENLNFELAAVGQIEFVQENPTVILNALETGFFDHPVGSSYHMASKYGFLNQNCSWHYNYGSMISLHRYLAAWKITIDSPCVKGLSYRYACPPLTFNVDTLELKFELSNTFSRVGKSRAQVLANYEYGFVSVVIDGIPYEAHLTPVKNKNESPATKFKKALKNSKNVFVDLLITTTSE